MDVSHTKIKTNDKLVRAKLIEELSTQIGANRVIEEFEVARGRVRADVIQLRDGGVHAYEIKSDVDTLLRLPRQIKYYNQVFSTVTLVVGVDHVVDSLYVIPDWWGVVVAQIGDKGLTLNQIREAKQNDHIDNRSVSDLFRKAELIRVLDSCDSKGNYWTMSKAKLVDEVHKELESDLFIDRLFDTLLNRTGYQSLSSLNVIL